MRLAPSLLVTDMKCSNPKVPPRLTTPFPSLEGHVLVGGIISVDLPWSRGQNTVRSDKESGKWHV